MDYNFWPQNAGTVGVRVPRDADPAGVLAAIQDTFAQQGYSAAKRQVETHLDMSPSAANAFMAQNGMQKTHGGGGGRPGPRKPLFQKKSASKSQVLAEYGSQGSCPSGFVQAGTGVSFDDGSGAWGRGARCVFVDPSAASNVTSERVAFTRDGKQIAYDVPYASGVRKGFAMTQPGKALGTTGGFFEAYNGMPGMLYKGSVATTAGEANNAGTIKADWWKYLLGAAIVYGITAAVRGKFNIFGK